MKLLRDLAKQSFKGITPELRANLLAFYENPKPPLPNAKQARKPDEKDQKDWPKPLAALEQLRALQVPSPSVRSAGAPAN